MDKNIVARLEELERERMELLQGYKEICEACGLNGVLCTETVCAAYKWRVVWGGENPETPPKSRFDRIRACAEPWEMVIELNGNERRFCPKSYSKTQDTCGVSCGECIVSWLREGELS